MDHIDKDTMQYLRATWSSFSEMLPECPVELVDAFTHNRPLTEVEQLEKKRLRDKTRADLVWRTQIISDIDMQKGAKDSKQRQQLFKEMIPLARALAICKHLEAPIRNVPFDILREIAIHGVPLSPGVPTFRQFNSPFSKVCSAWREAALSSPQVWTALFLKITGPASLKEAATIEWFKRAKGLPITFYIEYSPAAPPVLPIDWLASFFTSISPHLGHLSHLGFRSKTFEPLRLFLEMPLRWEVSELQQLDIRSHYNHHFYSDSRAPLFSTPPPLKKMTMEVLPDIPDMVDNFVQWSQLTDLRLSGTVELREWFHIMELSNNLRVASFILWLNHSVGSPPPASLMHPHIENLALQLTPTCSIMALHQIMQTVQFPRLKTLEFFRNDMRFRGEPHNGPVDPHPFINHLQEFEHLTSLSLHYYHDENFAPLLLKTINLRTLSVDMLDAFSHQLVVDLSLPETAAGHILPRLSSIQMTYSLPLMPQHHDAFTQMIRSRWTTVDGPLQEVILNVRKFEGYSYATRAVAQLDKYAGKCRRSGLHVEVHNAEIKTRLAYQLLPPIKTFDDLGLE